MAGKNDEQQWSHDQSFPEEPLETKHQIITEELFKGVGIFNNNQHFGFSCYSKKQTIFLLIFFLSLVCFSPFEENEHGCRKPRYSPISYPGPC